MPDHKVLVYRRYRSVVTKTLFAIGFWPSKNPSWFYRIIPFIHISLCLGPICGMYGFFKKYISNVVIMTKGLSIMTSVMTIVMKLSFMYTYQQDLKDLRAELDSYFNRLITNEKYKDLVLKDAATFYYLAMSVVLSIFTVCVAYGSGPIIYLIVQYAKHSPNVKYILPYPGVYPWDIPPHSFLYLVHFIVESLANWSSFCVTASLDSGYTFFVFQMVGLMREISNRFLHLDKDKDYEVTLRQCVDQYEFLMKCRDRMQRIYGPVVLWTMISNAIIMCAVIFQLSHITSMSFGRMILFTCYAFFKVSQTFIYAWAGTSLTTESENCREAIYSIDWIGDKKLMSSIIILLTQQPFTLTACKFSVVSVGMFVAVMNTTVSYFFLLQTIDEK